MKNAPETGIVEKKHILAMEFACRVPKREYILTRALVESGLLELLKNGDLYVHDWHLMQGKAVERAAKDATYQKKRRAAVKAAQANNQNRATAFPSRSHTETEEEDPPKSPSFFPTSKQLCDHDPPTTSPQIGPQPAQESQTGLIRVQPGGLVDDLAYKSNAAASWIMSVNEQADLPAGREVYEWADKLFENEQSIDATRRCLDLAWSAFVSDCREGGRYPGWGLWLMGVGDKRFGQARAGLLPRPQKRERERSAKEQKEAQRPDLLVLREVLSLAGTVLEPYAASQLCGLEWRREDDLYIGSTRDRYFLRFVRENYSMAGLVFEGPEFAPGEFESDDLAACVVTN